MAEEKCEKTGGCEQSIVVKCKLYIFNSLKKTSFVDFTVKPDVLLMGTLQCCGAMFQY